MPDFGVDRTDRKVFGYEIRALREQKAWTQDDLAQAMSYSLSTVKNLESGYRLPTLDQCVLLDKAFGLPGIFERMHKRHRGIPLSAGFRPFAPHEAEATTIKTFQHSLIPGLFQTEDYARTILATHPGSSPDDIQSALEARLARQAILDEADPPWIWAVLDEQVLARDVGGPAVMAAQLAHLVELSRRTKITVQVLPAQAHTGLTGAFVIAENSQPPAVAYLDTALDGIVLEDQKTAQRLIVLFDSLRTEALPGEASRMLIEERSHQWQERTTP